MADPDPPRLRFVPSELIMVGGVFELTSLPAGLAWSMEPGPEGLFAKVIKGAQGVYGQDFQCYLFWLGILGAPVFLACAVWNALNYSSYKRLLQRPGALRVPETLPRDLALRSGVRFARFQQWEGPLKQVPLPGGMQEAKRIVGAFEERLAANHEGDTRLVHVASAADRPRTGAMSTFPLGAEPEKGLYYVTLGLSRIAGSGIGCCWVRLRAQGGNLEYAVAYAVATRFHGWRNDEACGNSELGGLRVVVESHWHEALASHAPGMAALRVNQRPTRSASTRRAREE